MYLLSFTSIKEWRKSFKSVKPFPSIWPHAACGSGKSLFLRVMLARCAHVNPTRLFPTGNRCGFKNRENTNLPTHICVLRSKHAFVCGPKRYSNISNMHSSEVMLVFTLIRLHLFARCDVSDDVRQTTSDVGAPTRTRDAERSGILRWRHDERRDADVTQDTETDDVNFEAECHTERRHETTVGGRE